MTRNPKRKPSRKGKGLRGRERRPSAPDITHRETEASGTGAGALPRVAISALVIDKNLADTIYIGTDIGVFRTRDGGNNWEPFNAGLPRIIVTGLVLRRMTNQLYASTMGRGAYRYSL